MFLSVLIFVIYCMFKVAADQSACASFCIATCVNAKQGFTMQKVTL